LSFGTESDNHMSQKLKVLFVASEAAPLVKTGGLADVAFALPRALNAQGHDVRVAIPCYGSIPEAYRGDLRGTCFVNVDSRTQFGAWRESHLPGTNVKAYLVEHEGYFNRPHPYFQNGNEYGDNLERFCFFCMGVLDSVAQTGWRPDIVHCNDWHTAVVPAYLKTRLAEHPFWKGVASLLTIHNIRYQGRYSAGLLPKTGLDPSLFTPECLEFYGDINLLKAGIKFASKINTVSRTYAREIQTPAYGHGLDGFLRTRRADLVGIVNGVDYEAWDPASDPHVPVKFFLDDLSGKRQCKELLQREQGLPGCEAPLFVMVSRLVWDKGLDLVTNALDRLLLEDLQLVILGTGDPHYERTLECWTARAPDKIRVILAHDEALAHRLYAAADFFLMPSLTEPCGLSQMYALRYGAVPIVRKTGGLADTVVDASPANIMKGTATGIVFRPPSAEALVRGVFRALRLYAEPEVLKKVRHAGMSADFSWERASRAYVDLYRKAMADS